MDNLTPGQRAKNMRRVKSKDTSPEMAVRRRLFALGYRYRVHYSGVPGKPDVVFPTRRLAIFIHGCFWHQHEGCKKAKRPATRRSFWNTKLDRNMARDRDVRRDLEAAGWTQHVIWECELKDVDAVVLRLVEVIKKHPAQR
ncbi:DNA mismatch endonuclease Vsr [bacterium]|nr:DNA mismatch endonuclease Vsr [bacterium]